jgi:transcription elongation factor Elf1
MKNERLYEFTCPYCGNYEKVELDIDEVEEVICKKCNQKIDLDELRIVESSNMEFHGDTPTIYNPNENKQKR